MNWITSIQVLAVLVLCACMSSVNCNRKDYTGYQILRVTSSNAAEVKFLRNLQLTDDSLIFGARPSSVGRPVQILVAPYRVSEVTSLLKGHRLEVSVQTSNVQSFLDSLWNSLEENRKLAFDINDFNTMNDINSWLITMVNQCRTGLVCQMTSLGNSYGSNPLNIFRISKSGTGRKAIFIDATTQSSDWIATSTALHLINTLALGSDAEAIRLTDEFDWHILPLANPDGYNYTFVSDRYWSKNRRQIGSCYGTNLNVNFDNRWGEEGVSHSPCNNEFCGTSPASEPETRLIQDELRRLASTLRATVSLHAYGNTWAFSYGFTVGHAGEECSQSIDHNNMMAIADAAANAVEATYNTVWARGTVCDTVAPVSGIAVDYIKESAGVYNAFALNLRGDSLLIDASEIGPAFMEVWNGIVAMIDAIEGK